jgi:hypothetical protein
MARLTYKARKKLPRTSFAVPSKDGYPIHDKAHARNALARVSQFGSPSEKAKVRAAVHRRFPTIGKKRKRVANPVPGASVSGTGGYVPQMDMGIADTSRRLRTRKQSRGGPSREDVMGRSTAELRRMLKRGNRFAY